MLTIHGLTQAYALSEDLRRLREAVAAIAEDKANRSDMRVHQLRRTYGNAGDTHTASCVVQKSRLLEMLADEEAEIVAMLRDMGIEAQKERP